MQTDEFNEFCQGLGNLTPQQAAEVFKVIADELPGITLRLPNASDAPYEQNAVPELQERLNRLGAYGSLELLKRMERSAGLV